MNDEIKEMLDNIKDIVNGYTKICNYNQDEVIYDEINYSPKQWYLLLDYITNLQEDMKNYIDIVLYQRKTIDNLQQENERIEKEYKSKVDDTGKLTSRIYKANELIKDWHQEYNGLMETNNIYIPKDKPSLFDLKDVLNGSDSQ